jgi:CBS domain-containing protein
MRQVKDVMTRLVYTISAMDSVSDAADRMRIYEVGALPVREGEQVVGMLTDRDIVTRVVAHGRAPSATTVSEVMSAPIVSCSESLPIWRAAKMMEEHALRRLLVLGRNGAVAGILSYDDLAVLPPSELVAPERAHASGSAMH